MSLRLALAAVAVAALAAPAAAVPPPCQLEWEPFVSTSPGVPVAAEISRPSGWTC